MTDVKPPGSVFDVSEAVEIAAAPADIAAVMFDPAREPEWMTSVGLVEVVDNALRPGARVRHTGRLFGQPVTWTTTVEAVHFPHVLTLRVSDGPFTGIVNYQIQRSPGGSTARIQNRGDGGAIGGGAGGDAAALEEPIREILRADLARLKTLVES